MRNRQADIVNGMKGSQIIFHLYATQFLLLVVSIILGFFLFNDMDSFFMLWTLDLKQILIYGGGSAILVIIIDFLIKRWVAKHVYDDGGINELVFRNRNYFHIFFLCIIIAFAEELLFRGIIQTHFGIVIASVIFALLHVRYLYKWVLFTAVVLLSFLLGYLYLMTNNLLVTFFAHFLIDFVFALKIRKDYLQSDNE
ncbi:type II CAAX endopeptidase family protein [Cytobacillus sp. S13-E01]|uniref:CPBP family intramembrane glutamic endopeptidase n=1 Tax=Cytobacillus sp. S13-E01 TaxID=3031326 RepID=UPI0023D83551|nr:type II CAAX endopeptidase family protein [Cytobacillus sp. S13-E01]MDF0726186.1 type II CAAX endopeptidase family protein [Cytobacillus sp. S13-E01]